MQQSTKKGIYELAGGALVLLLSIVYGVQISGEDAEKIKTGIELLGAALPGIIGAVQAVVGLHNIKRDERKEEK